MSTPVAVALAPTLTTVAGTSDVELAVTCRITEDELRLLTCTRTGPVIAVAGTVTVNDVAVAAEGVALTVPEAAVNRNVLFAAVVLNADPVNVTAPPRLALVGAIE